jgi:hypothetical protein
MSRCRVRMHRFGGVIPAAFAMSLCACVAIFGTEDLELTLDVSGTTVRPNAPITVTVAATNRSDEAIVWGRGSSSCQLDAVVAVGTDLFRIDIRACTDDLAPQGLDPDETRVEKWSWNGEILVQGALDTLPPGDYRIWATAGSLARSNLKTVAFEPASQATVQRP